MIGLLDLLEEHGEAVEYDLIDAGLRLRWLGTEALTWRDLLVRVRRSSKGSALYRALHPAPDHTQEVELLRRIEYHMHFLWWAKTEDGAKGRNRPEVYRFPWEPKPRSEYAGDVMTKGELDRRLGWTDELKGGA